MSRRCVCIARGLARTTHPSAEDSVAENLCGAYCCWLLAGYCWLLIPGSALLYTAERDISPFLYHTILFSFSRLLLPACWRWLSATILAQRAHDGILFHALIRFVSANRYTNASWLLQGSLLLPGPTATPPFCKSSPGSRVLSRTPAALPYYLASPYQCVRGKILPQL